MTDTSRADHSQHPRPPSVGIIAMRDHGTGECFHVVTPQGPAELTVVSIEANLELWPLEIGRSPAIHGDRAIVRSHVEGCEDVYAVFERAGRGTRWCTVTPELTAEQMDHWSAFRRTAAGNQTRDFDTWLTRIRDQQRTTSSRELQQ